MAQIIAGIVGLFGIIFVGAIGGLVAIVILSGCIPRDEYSENKTEQAVVLALSYSPEQHGSSSGIAITSNGNGGMGVGPSFGSVDIDESYAVVFKCQHGTFVVRDEKAKHLFSKVRSNEDVTLTYREVYSVDRNSKNEIVSKEFKKFELLGVDELKS